jgi:hypothetical protein
MSLPATVVEKLLRTEDCWQWKAATNAHGYGVVRYEGRNHLAHRLIYEILVGPILDGLELDHLCRNRGCVRPDHLEPVSRRENQLRGFAFSGINSRKTHCPKGHPYTPENIYQRPGGDPRRYCRRCIAEYRAKRRTR